MSLPMFKEKKPWYHKGLRFKCTQCGQCCTGSSGYVWLEYGEMERIAKHLNISLDDFIKKYIRIVSRVPALLDQPGTDHCIFLKDKRCTIYPVRPKQCQVFPWWPGNLSSKENWEEAGSHCEGIDHPEGQVFSVKEIDSHL